MRISTQTNVAHRRFGMPDAVRVLKEAGFDAYDFSMFHDPDKNPVFTDGWREHLSEIKAAADAVGIVCNQAHAPFPSSKSDEAENRAYNDTIFERLVRSVEAAAFLGADAIVIHPVQHLPYHKNAEKLFDMNMDFYRSLAPYAKRQGIKIALENMWQTDPRRKIIWDSTCATAEEFIRYFDTLADPEVFTCCLDLGHCGLSGYEAAGMIRALGADRLGALHIHDNDHLRDAHTLPYLGRMDWKEIMKALGEIGYKGDFTYEADCFLQSMPTELLPDAYRFMVKTAQYMMNMITP